MKSEKSCLEQKLNERRNRRRLLEQLLENVNVKYLQMKDIHSKMTETLKVAQHKASQTQSLANSLDANNQCFKRSITDLNQKAEKEKKIQMENVAQFEDNLLEVSNAMFVAREIHLEENLRNCISHAEKAELELNLKFKNYLNSFKEMELNVHNMKLVPEIVPDYNDFYVEQRKDLWLFFLNEHKEANKCLLEITTQVNNAKEMEP